jgi:branched-subunit amino acid transport protein
MALVSYLPRVVPFTIFKKRINSIYIQSLLSYMPYAVLGAMTFPSIFYSTSNMLFSTLGTGVALLLAYKGQKLLPVAVISVGVIYLLNVFCI